jgi:glycerol uptake facilitator-like aquaporin
VSIGVKHLCAVISVHHFRKRSPQRTIALNVLAELSASGIYSLLFFIFVGRHISPSYDLSFIVLSFAIGLSYFAGVFIPFHTYRIAIIPFISITNAIRKRQWRVIWHKLPAQFLGAFIGAWIFHRLNTLVYSGDLRAMQTFQLNDPWLLAFVNGAAAAMLCYAFYIIRFLFKERRSIGTILLSMVMATLFLLTGKFVGMSALNPFGLFSYQLISGTPLFQGPWYMLLLTHVVFPVSLSVMAFYLVREMYGLKRRAGVKEKNKMRLPSLEKNDI